MRQYKPKSRHPGGLALTRRLLECSGLSAGCTMADIGCGDGASTAFLLEQGLSCIGVEPDRNGYAENLPFPDSCMDALLYECVLSITDREQSLKEAYRVLKPKGKLLVSDVYIADTQPDFPGFQMLHWEDHRKALLHWQAQAIFDDEPCDFPVLPGKKYSYYLAVLEK